MYVRCRLLDFGYGNATEEFLLVELRIFLTREGVHGL